MDDIAYRIIGIRNARHRISGERTERIYDLRHVEDRVLSGDGIRPHGKLHFCDAPAASGPNVMGRLPAYVVPSIFIEPGTSVASFGRRSPMTTVSASRDPVLTISSVYPISSPTSA